VDGIFGVTTKDGYTLRVSIVIFPVIRIRSSQRILLRRLMQDKLQEKVERLNFDQLVQEMVLGKVASEIYNEGKKICPLRHVGVRKSKLLLFPEEGEPRLSFSTTGWRKNTCRRRGVQPALLTSRSSQATVMWQRSSILSLKSLRVRNGSVDSFDCGQTH
jgi:hypothetical protein